MLMPVVLLTAVVYLQGPYHLAQQANAADQLLARRGDQAHCRRGPRRVPRLRLRRRLSDARLLPSLLLRGVAASTREALGNSLLGVVCWGRGKESGSLIVVHPRRAFVSHLHAAAVWPVTSGRSLGPWAPTAGHIGWDGTLNRVVRARSLRFRGIQERHAWNA